MKKQLHILQGIIILLIILIISLLLIKFLYKINNEKIDTTYIWNLSLNNLNIKGNEKSKTTINDNTITSEIILEKETDYYEYTFDITNKGTKKAKLNSLNIEANNPKNILVYTIKYIDNKEIKVGDIINSNDKKTIKVRVEYPKQKDKIYDEVKLLLNINFEYKVTD